MPITLAQDHLADQRQTLRVILEAAVESPVYSDPVTNQVAPPFFVVGEPSISFPEYNRAGEVLWPITLAWVRTSPQSRIENIEQELQRALLALGGLKGFALRGADPTTLEDNNIELPAYLITLVGVLPNCR